MDNAEQKRLRELALRALHSGTPAFTRFLDPALEQETLSAAAQTGVHAAFYGGYDDAERRIAAFWTDMPPEAEDYPIACLELCWNPKYGHPGHRDLLGAVMGLGLERDSTGDIALGQADGTAYLFAHTDMEAYICASLDSAGRSSLKVQQAKLPIALREPEGEQIRITVASMRLDAIIAAGLKLSRGEAQRLITAGMVKRNHIVECRGDVHLESGDLISVRGYGRMRVIEDTGLTRKGRYAMRLFRYKG